MWWGRYVVQTRKDNETHLATGMKNHGFEYRDDKEKILDDSFKELMAKGIANGIELYFDSDSSQ